LQYLFFIGGLVVILITGLIKIRRAISTLIHKHDFVHAFREKFVQFSNPYVQQQQRLFGMEQAVQPDAQLYHWLVSNMDKTQRLLGIYGRGLYTAPFHRFQIPSYEYILNTVNQMRTGDADTQDLSMCDNMMVRYLGDMGRLIEEEQKDIKNPIAWLQQGIQFYIGFPIRLLNWFGIISETSFDNIVSSKLFKALAGLGGLVAFISSLVTILQGWPAVKELIDALK
jgi:hypothetical protein